ncbi:MAG: exodeoxyribonuclease I [Candidatus Saccharibacteria bacterium]|nr:exodeoxyribonuclease I [Candidatus Saccharibacteria bacterium]
MAETLYFYDLETSGFNPREQRIMQFAGQRTDLDLKPIGEPHNILIALSEDILPDPDAILITGITPQQTIAEGISEAEFLKIFNSEVALPGTIFTGYNTIRFDDEFMRYSHYRNLYDPYEWQWRDDRSKWDLLDLVRITRALRPEGIKWPFDDDGKPSNRLGMLTSINELEHENAHDALSDVRASIDLARLIHAKQPKLFNYSLVNRSKQKVAELVLAGKPFVYTSGKFDTEYEKTAVVSVVAKGDDRQSVVVFDLRFDPNDYKDMSVEELAEAMRWHKPGEKVASIPVKTIKFNRCPAVAPISVLNAEVTGRLKIDMSQVAAHQEALAKLPDFANNILKAVALLDKQQQTSQSTEERTVDAQMYDGFMGDSDKRLMAKLRTINPSEFNDYLDDIQDKRLKNLLPLYKARNYLKNLTSDERQVWDEFKNARLFSGDNDSRMAKFMKRIEELRALPATNDQQQYLLTELELYGQSLLPTS